jgi:hypothetical protein
MYNGFEFDGSNNKVVVDVEYLKGDLLKTISPTQLKLLLAIVANMDSNGNSYPSMRTLQEITGMSLTTVNKNVKELLDVEVNGSPVIYRRFEGTGLKRFSIYSFVEDITPVTVEGVEEKEKEKVFTGKMAIDLFCTTFLEEFGYKYKVSGAKDGANIRRLLNTYDEEQVRAIISITVLDYKKRWSTPSYPVPTIGAMCSWIAVKALEIHNNKTKNTNKWDNIENDEDSLDL